MSDALTNTSTLSKSATPKPRIRSYQFTDSPPDLPSPQDIIDECNAAYDAAWDAGEFRTLRGIRLANGSAFVKFNVGLKYREAEIQHYVYEYLRANGRGHVRVPRVYTFLKMKRSHVAYIVMELIEGATCDKTHVPQAARALEELITIPAPTAAPGPVRPGPIDHFIFEDGVSEVSYPSIADLQLHFNRILKDQGHKDTVDFVAEVQAHGLCLCPSDMDATNFMVDARGQLVAIDFGQTSFLPSCFFDFAITSGRPYTNLLYREVVYPKYPSPEKSHIDALDKVGYIFVMGSNTYKLPRHLRPKRDDTAPTRSDTIVPDR